MIGSESTYDNDKVIPKVYEKIRAVHKKVKQVFAQKFEVTGTNENESNKTMG